MGKEEQAQQSLQAQKAVPAETALDVVVGQSQQEMQAALVIAQRFGRDEQLAREHIVTWARDPDNAQAARFSYPRKGADGKEVVITDATIRCAEGVAQAWGHMRCGFQVLEDTGQDAKVRAYAWDLLSNLFAEVSFALPFVRKSGTAYRRLEDPRDQYEHTANMASRRLRTCIFRVLPSWVKSLALREADETIEKSAPAEAGKAEAAFAEWGVTKEMLEAYMAKTMDAMNRADYRKLRNMYNAIHEGFAKVADIFGAAVSGKPDAGAEPASESESSAAGIKAKADAERAAAQVGIEPQPTPEAPDNQGTPTPNVQGIEAIPDDVVDRAEAFARQWSVACKVSLPARKAVLNLCRDMGIETVEALAGAMTQPDVSQRPFWGDTVCAEVSAALQGVYKEPTKAQQTKAGAKQAQANTERKEAELAAWRTKPREELECEFDRLYTLLSSSAQAEAQMAVIIREAGIESFADIAVKSQEELASLLVALTRLAKQEKAK